MTVSDNPERMSKETGQFRGKAGTVSERKTKAKVAPARMIGYRRGSMNQIVMPEWLAQRGSGFGLPDSGRIVLTRRDHPP